MGRRRRSHAAGLRRGAAPAAGPIASRSGRVEGRAAMTSARRSLVVIGDTVLDRDVEGVVERVSPEGAAMVLDQRRERSRPGGAGLAALMARELGAEVTLVTALGGAAGEEARGLLEDAGVRVVDLDGRGETPEKIRLRC